MSNELTAQQDSNYNIQIMNKYPKKQYNCLIPVETVQQQSEVFTPIVNQVSISPVLEDGDVYIEKKAYGNKPNEYALTKKGLTKLMTAAGIEVVSSEKIIPSTHLSIIEAIRATGKSLPFNDDVAYKVMIKIPTTHGGYRYVTETREINFDTLSQSMSDKQLQKLKEHRHAQCETKALLRCLRTALMIKPTYLKQELQKPFIVAYAVPNLNNEDVRKAALQQLSGASQLFGTEEIQVIDTGETLQIVEPEEGQTPEELEDDGFPEDVISKEQVFQLEEIITNKKVTKNQIIEHIKAQYSKDQLHELNQEEFVHLVNKLGNTPNR